MLTCACMACVSVIAFSDGVSVSVIAFSDGVGDSVSVSVGVSVSVSVSVWRLAFASTLALDDLGISLVRVLLRLVPTFFVILPGIVLLILFFLFPLSSPSPSFRVQTT